MATSQSKFDLNAWFAEFAAQFQGLNPKEPGQWPLAPKLAAALGVVVVVVVAGYFVVLSDMQDGLEAERNREPQLRQDYKGKLAQAVNLPELRTGAISTQLAGTMDNLNDTVTFKLKGTVRLFLPGNSSLAPSAEVTIKSGRDVCAKICAPTYHMKLSGFELKVAGFTLGLTNPRGTDDGGYMADSVTLKVPAGTQNGRRLRLRERGLPRPDRRRGDLHAVVRIVVPERPSAAKREAYETLKRVAGVAADRPAA